MTLTRPIFKGYEICHTNLTSTQFLLYFGPSDTKFVKPDCKWLKLNLSKFQIQGRIPVVGNLCSKFKIGTLFKCMAT